MSEQDDHDCIEWSDFDEDEFDDDDDWVCFEDTCVCDDGMCGESELDDETAPGLTGEQE